MSAMQEAEQRAAALVQKGISPQDAVSQIFKSDPDLYRRYRQEAPSSRMVSPLPSYEGNGVHKHAPAARRTIRQAAERVLLDMAEEVVKREGCDPAEAIEAAASTVDGRALYNVIRDPRSWATPLPERTQKTAQTAAIQIRKATVVHMRKAARELGQEGSERFRKSCQKLDEALAQYERDLPPAA